MGRGGRMTDSEANDAQKLAELVIDLEKGLRFIRAAQGYGRVTVTRKKSDCAAPTMKSRQPMSCGENPRELASFG